MSGPRRLPYNLEGYRAGARRVLPRAIFDFVDGGAGDEWTMRENGAAFDRTPLLPSVLRDVSDVSLATTVAGRRMASPLMLAPAGLVGMVHPEGERAQVRAAWAHGIVAVTSSASTYSFEELTEAVPEPGGRPWFQLYPYQDRGFYGEMVSRAAAAGFTGLCLTVDASVSGKRERDLANNLSVKPLRVTWGTASGAARHPRWLAGVLRERRIVARMTTESLGQDRPPLRSLLRSAGGSAASLVELLPRKATWDDLVWLRDKWSGPLSVKGIVHPRDAKQAAALGVDTLVVSNHGGRQLDGVPATLDLLPRVRDAVGDSADLVLDGGVRRGADVVKALCLGAQACMIGRPWVYGLAVAGEQGVNGVLDVLEDEIATTMALLGVREVAQLGSDQLA